MQAGESVTSVGPEAALLDSCYSTVQSSPIVVCIRLDDEQVALNAARAVLLGGLQCIEVTMTTPKAPTIIRKLVQEFPNATIGAGTVLTQDEADSARDAGARFALSPIIDIKIIQYCNSIGMLSIPGAATPTEVFHASNVGGARVVKIFPVNLYGGLKFVKALQGPLPQIPLLPTSGINLETLGDYLACPNVAAVGASRQILPHEALRTSDWPEISRRAGSWAKECEKYRAM